MKTENVTARLNTKQLDRLSDILLYWGLTTRTDILKAALNHLENALRGGFMMNLVDAVSSMEKKNKKIEQLESALLVLKRHAKIL